MYYGDYNHLYREDYNHLYRPPRPQRHCPTCARPQRHCPTCGHCQCCGRGGYVPPSITWCDMNNDFSSVLSQLGVATGVADTRMAANTVTVQ